jgi:hypothetical protein
MHAKLLVIVDNEYVDTYYDNLDDLMKPFYIGNEFDLDPEYLEFEVVTNAKDFEEIFRQHMSKLDKIKDKDEIKELLKLSAENLGLAVAEIQGFKYNKELNATGYYYNPNAHWDWYVVGGRWEDFFILKKEFLKKYGSERVDECLKGEIDWEKMKQERIQEKIKYLELNNKNAKINPTKFEFKEINVEKIAEETTPISVYAILHEGEWKEDLTDEEIWEYIEDRPDDTKFILVDYHW